MQVNLFYVMNSLIIGLNEELNFSVWVFYSCLSEYTNGASDVLIFIAFSLPSLIFSQENRFCFILWFLIVQYLLEKMYQSQLDNQILESQTQNVSMK